MRAILLLRARTLAAGYSGVRSALPERLLELLAADLLPVVPGKGSVGASGDLAQLAHLAQPLIGEGRLRAPGDGPHGRPAAEVLAEHGIEPLELAPKEGLSLVNGTEPMQALLAFSVRDADLLLRAADVACALSIEALLGTDRPYDERVQIIRPHPGQLDSAANLRALLAGSELMASHRHSRHAVQDAYSMRCAPQVHGAVRDVLGYARRVIETELGSVVDNPVIVPDGEVMTTGNFHGEPLAFAADMLAMAISELASISERRVDRMLDPASSRGLPPFLAPNAGTNSGYMLAQYTAASLVSENKVLAHPASVDTIPTSGKQEDHVSMGWTAVRKLRDVLVNVRTCLAVEILCAVQGIDLRSSVGTPSGPLAAVRDVVRARVPMMAVDREVSGQIVAVDELIPEICETAAGALRWPEIGAPVTVWMNGTLLADSDARISVFDHGLTVGDGVFETVRISAGVPFALTRHLARLSASAAGLGLPAPDLDQVRVGIAALLDAAGGPPGPDADHADRGRITARLGPRGRPGHRDRGAGRVAGHRGGLRRGHGPVDAERARRAGRPEDDVVRGERAGARLRPGARRRRGDLRQYGGEPVRGHRDQRVRGVRRAAADAAAELGLPGRGDQGAGDRVGRGDRGGPSGRGAGRRAGGVPDQHDQGRAAGPRGQRAAAACRSRAGHAPGRRDIRRDVGGAIRSVAKT